jgi:hypothetical protein
MPDDEDAGNSRDDQSASQSTQSTRQTISIAYDVALNIGVISNITGDRTPDGTSLSINDPLRLNVGDTYSVSFADFREVYRQNSK